MTNHPLHAICGSILLPTASEQEEEEQCNDVYGQCSRDTSERVSRRAMIQHEIDFLQDDESTMTFSRRVAVYLMKKYAWYNPQLDEESGGASEYAEIDDISSVGSFNRSMHRSPLQKERPSLDKAWAYFEHVTLPRYLDHNAAIHGTGTSETKSNSNRGFRGQLRRSVRRLILGHEDVMDLAEPGEDNYPTKLYSPLWTPMNQMGDFGLGVGLYFTALRSITLLALVCGLLNIPNMIYFAGDNYSNRQDGVDIFLKGSAVCTEQEYVPCPTCSIDDFADTPHRIATASSFYGEEDLIFVVKNYCDGAKLQLVMVNFATLVLVFVGMTLIGRHLKKQEILFDEDEQTCQDYSIVIRNPPPDATDPDEWKTFFDTNFGSDVHTTCCTVARDNYLLVRALVRRRELLQKLKWALPPGTSLDIPSLNDTARDLKQKRTTLEKIKALAVPGVPELVCQLGKINEAVQKLAMLDFPATRVYVTFETEAAQRRILTLLSIGSKAVKRNDVMKVHDPSHLFRSKLVLNIKEADEPSTIRWHDLSDRFWDRFLKMCVTTYAWACVMFLVAIIIRQCSHKSAKFAAYAIAFFNTAFPEFAKILVNYESHPSERRLQTSMYVKIAAFRWINTAIIVTMITPFTSTLSSGSDNILDGVCEIFLAEIVTSNCIKLFDPMGFIKRHYLAPRAGSQEEMNSYMRGEEWHLAERYSSMTKILFLTLWYCSIYPAGFFLCAVTLFINYFAERFSLMRSWRPAPRLGSHISTFSRRYFFTMAISAMAVASSYTWAGFPYDNLCENTNADGNADDDTLQDYIGSWNVISIDDSRSVSVTVSQGDPSYRFCQQSLWYYGKGMNFPAIPYWQTEGDEWMTEEQEHLTSFYGWTSFALLLAVCLWILRRAVQTMIYRSHYAPCGEDQGISFSNVAAISSYVPEVKSDVFPYPLVAVDTDDVDEELYEWKDPEKPYSYYDLTRDANEILKEKLLPEKEVKSLFSRIKHWPPNQDEYISGQEVDLEEQYLESKLC